jgi:hypothetical protein
MQIKWFYDAQYVYSNMVDTFSTFVTSW